MHLQLFGQIKSQKNGANLLNEKLRLVVGDLTLPTFGLSPKEMATLSNNVSIVINSATPDRLDEPFDVAVKKSTYSISQLLEFCNGLAKLEALIHVSSAYSNCHKRDLIHEIFYEPPMKQLERSGDLPEKVAQLMQLEASVHAYPNILAGAKEQEPPLVAGEQSRNVCKIQPRLLWHRRHIPAVDFREALGKVALRRSNRPNSYTFTKALAESYLLDLLSAKPQQQERYLNNNQVQVAIVRPSIVCGLNREPLAGFVDNFEAPAIGAIVSASMGALQAIPGDCELVADLIPADMTANMIICSASYIISNKKTRMNANANLKKEDNNNDDDDDDVKRDFGVYIFNFVSGSRNPVRWKLIAQLIAQLAYKYPSTYYLLRLPAGFSYFIKAGKLYDYYDFLHHKCPALIEDFVREKIFREKLGPKTSALSAYTRIRTMTKTLTPFSSCEWRFSDTNVVKLFNSMSKVDKDLFNFDVTTINWPDFIRNFIIGSQIYALKDEPASLKGLKT